MEDLKRTHDATVQELKKEFEDNNQKLINKMELQSENIRSQVEVKNFLYLSFVFIQ